MSMKKSLILLVFVTFSIIAVGQKNLRFSNIKSSEMKYDMWQSWDGYSGTMYVSYVSKKPANIIIEDDKRHIKFYIKANDWIKGQNGWYATTNFSFNSEIIKRIGNNTKFTKKPIKILAQVKSGGKRITINFIWSETGLGYAWP